MSVKSRKEQDARQGDSSKEKVGEKRHDDASSKEKQRKNDHRLLYKISLVITSILAFITRAWMLHHPDEVVFDEVHFGKFASFYLRGEYYFDVHPPLGKMLLAAVGYIVGYDGHFLFEKIGENYPENNVPYVAFRLWCALCGAAVVPTSFLILQELGVSVIGCTLGALFLVFDTALVTQSRLILLDSMLMLFCILSLYFWIKFYRQRHRPFSFNWWFWLSMTGVGIAAVTGVKMVGLFTVLTIGIATLFDLWELFDIKRGMPMKTFGKHFGARALCLIFIPYVVYLVPFYIHFKVLTKSGTGDAFMSLQFQETLLGNKETVGSTFIPYSSNITIKHPGTKVYLHSHVHKIPLRHADGRISSQGQQVNGYAHHDENSLWEIELLDQSIFKWDLPKLNDLETKRNVRYVRSNDLIRLRHITTDSYLKTHDVASPLTQTNMEFTTIKTTDKKYGSEINETIWKIVADGESSEAVLKSKKNMFKVVSFQHNVAMHTHKEKLPDWGFNMQEINGNKKVDEAANNWIVEKIQHERIVNGFSL